MKTAAAHSRKCLQSTRKGSTATEPSFPPSSTHRSDSRSADQTPAHGGDVAARRTQGRGLRHPLARHRPLPAFRRFSPARARPAPQSSENRRARLTPHQKLPFHESHPNRTTQHRKHAVPRGPRPRRRKGHHGPRAGDCQEGGARVPRGVHGGAAGGQGGACELHAHMNMHNAQCACACACDMVGMGEQR